MQAKIVTLENELKKKANEYKELKEKAKSIMQDGQNICHSYEKIMLLLN